MSKVSVSVSVSDDHVDHFPEVVEGVRAAGLEVAQELDLIGVVSGSIEEERMDDLRSVPGVAAVEPDREFQIAPPDSAIQSAPASSEGYDEAASTSSEYEPSSDYGSTSDYEAPEAGSGSTR